MRAAWTNSCIQGTCVHANDFYSDQVDLAGPGSKMSQTSMQRAARSQSSMNFRDLAAQKLSSRASNHSFAEGGPLPAIEPNVALAQNGVGPCHYQGGNGRGPERKRFLRPREETYMQRMRTSTVLQTCFMPALKILQVKKRF